MSENLIQVNQLLDRIRSGKEGRDEVIVMLYKDSKLRNSFKKMMRNEGWPVASFETMLTDSIIAFASSVIRRRDFELKSSLNNYLLVIGKRLYVKENMKEQKLSSIDGYEDEIKLEDTALDLIINEEREDLIKLLLGKLGKNCREVLMYWASQYSMVEIAEKMGYKSDMMARKKKYKCFNEMMKLLQDHPEIKKILR